AAAAGNSSGVVFADLTGDGWADLYLGRAGASWAGALNALLINDGAGCFTDQTAARIPGERVAATVDVAAADLDLDGDLDLAVANRCRRAPPCGAESEDYVLINDGAGNFAPVVLNAGLATDSRSVALGDLNKDFGAGSTPSGWPELVFGNAGSDGFSNILVPPPGEDHPMQIFVNDIAIGGALNAFTDVVGAIFSPATEAAITSPLTRQVRLVDIFGPTANAPDGWLDLVIVNSRDILKNLSPLGAAGSVWVIVNNADWSSAPLMIPFTAFPSAWVRAVAVADFTQTGFPDLLELRGNRFSGVQSETHKNLGTAQPLGQPWDFSGGFIALKSYESHPGNERGYGFDFADVGDDRALDALQTSRGYDYLVRDILHPSQPASHQEYAPGFFGNGLTSNIRGRLRPWGMEDGIFADFDADGALDAVLASQRIPSAHWPIATHGNATPDTIVLVQGGPGQFGFGTVGNPFVSVDDARIDLVNRVTHPSIADRAVAGDL
ncbi:MAG: FG-GAP-like repeat-containing protein, partial [Chloroflexi bacterium]|nr:FG-GAP-like repeat-containing protein [Chloroflexota bacterium]